MALENCVVCVGHHHSRQIRLNAICIKSKVHDGIRDQVRGKSALENLRFSVGKVEYQTGYVYGVAS